MKEKRQEHISLGGKKIPCETKMVDIFKLKFYPENPRILSIIKQKPKVKKDEKLIEKELWDNNETRKLSKRIEKHGGLIHEVIVHNNYVLEGNSRLCCYKRLYKMFKEDKWKFIKCKILLEKEISEEDIDMLLGDEHILGKIKWDTLEKGCWMAKMADEDGYPMEKIEEIVGHSKKWVKDHIWAYKTHVKEKIQDKKKFSHLIQTISNAEIMKIKREKDPEIIQKVITAIKKDQFPDAKDIRKVPSIWNDKKSRKRVFEYGEKVDQVYHELKAKDITLTSTFLRDAKTLTEKMYQLKRGKREEIEKDPQGKTIIKKLAKESIKLCDELGIKIHVPKKISK